MQRPISINKQEIKKVIKRLAMVGLVLAAANVSQSTAQTINLDAAKLLPRVELSFSPRVATFSEGSTFDVPILLNTRGHNINAIEVRVNFDRDRLEIIKPSSGQSFIGVWVEPPSYDNTRGLASYVGTIPGGITTSAGSVGTITFRAKKLGKAAVTFNLNSKVLLNDGQGSEAQVDLGRGEYTILPQAPEGVRVFSETHPFSSEWYNNDTPVLYWDKEEGVTGFSYVLDDRPLTIPENTLTTNETIKSFENLNDGLWYFHIKALKNGVWGATGHFLIRIDTAPPADFEPEVDYLVGAAVLSDRALISFFTTDNLSGIDHYEVGVIDKDQPITVSPVFIYAESPYQLPVSSDNLSAVVRAVDKAGNLRDVSVSIEPQSFLAKMMEDYLVYLLILIIVAGLFAWAFHYLVGHHIIRHLKEAFALAKKEEQALNVETYKQGSPKLNEITGYYSED